MSGTLGLLRIETRRSVAVWFVPVMALAGWYVSYDHLGNGIHLWGETRTQFGFAMVVIVPVAGAVAAWIAGRERRRGLGDALASTPVPAFRRDLAAWAASFAWCALAYLAVVGYRSIEVAREATWGGPDPFAIGIGLAAIAAASAFGYLVGALVPSRFAAILAGGALALAENQIDRHTFGGPDSPLRYLSPWRYLYGFWELAGSEPAFGASLLLWLVGIAAVLLALVALRRERSRPAWTMLAAAVLVAALGAGASIWTGSGRWAIARETPDPVCVETTIPVCFHPAYQKFLGETAAVVGAVVAPVVGVPGAPTHAVQFEAQLRSPSDDTLVLNVWRAGDKSDALAREIAIALATAEGVGAARVYPSEVPNEVQLAVARWLVVEAGYDPGTPSDWAWRLPACEERAWGLDREPGMDRPREIEACQAPVLEAIERFERIPEGERRAWLERNFAALRAGTVTVEDLP